MLSANLQLCMGTSIAVLPDCIVIDPMPHIRYAGGQSIRIIVGSQISSNSKWDFVKMMSLNFDVKQLLSDIILTIQLQLRL